MLGYYLKLAVRSFRRDIGLAALMVIVLGFGIGASMTVLTTLRAIGGDPIPDKSSKLFVPQIDVWGPQSRVGRAGGGPGRGFDSGSELPDRLTYRDAMALMQAHQAIRQTAMYGISLDVTQPDGVPFSVTGRAAYADFFQMFEVPLASGRAWSRDEDQQQANVVVLSTALAGRLFPHTNAVGKTVSLEGQQYRIIGVIAPWNPVPRYYDLTVGSGFRDSEELFLPFSTAIDHQMTLNGKLSCLSRPASGWEGRLNSECLWIEFWAELPNSAAVQDYRRFLYNYAAEQRQLGRFHWPPLVELHDVHDWLALEIKVPNTLRVSAVVAFGFLAVCLINAIGLLLARFAGRAAELGVRRALGASRRDIFLQCLAETGIAGLLGGIIGLALTAAGLAGQRALHNVNGGVAAVSQLTSLSWGVVLITLVVAVSATVCAGLYPGWRASRVQPGWQLKVQ